MRTRAPHVTAMADPVVPSVLPAPALSPAVVDLLLDGVVDLRRGRQCRPGQPGGVPAARPDHRTGHRAASCPHRGGRRPWPTVVRTRREDHPTRLAVIDRATAARAAAHPSPRRDGVVAERTRDAAAHRPHRDAADAPARLARDRGRDPAGCSGREHRRRQRPDGPAAAAARERAALPAHPRERTHRDRPGGTRRAVPAGQRRAGADARAGPATELAELSFHDVTHPDDLAADVALVEALLRDEIPKYQMEKRYLHSDGSPVWGRLTVTLVRADGRRPVLLRQPDRGHHARYAPRSAQLERRALYDPLTGLANRTLLLDRLAQAVRQHQDDEQIVAVAYCDLDHFKRVNDSLGHAAGDELLREVARPDVRRAATRRHRWPASEATSSSSCSTRCARWRRPPRCSPWSRAPSSGRLEIDGQELDAVVQRRTRHQRRRRDRPRRCCATPTPRSARPRQRGRSHWEVFSTAMRGAGAGRAVGRERAATGARRRGLRAALPAGGRPGDPRRHRVRGAGALAASRAGAAAAGRVPRGRRGRAPDGAARPAGDPRGLRVPRPPPRRALAGVRQRVAAADRRGRPGRCRRHGAGGGRCPGPAAGGRDHRERRAGRVRGVTARHAARLRAGRRPGDGRLRHRLLGSELAAGGADRRRQAGPVVHRPPR